MTTIGDEDSPDDSLLVINSVPHHNLYDAPHDDYDLGSISISNSYCGEWEKLFKCAGFQDRLRSFGMRGKLRSSRFRSVCWKYYLEVLSDDYSRWSQQTNSWRDKYDDLKEQLVTNPRRSEQGSDASLNNPLSQELESPWNQYFQDNELRVTIKQDVIRTFPDILFFQDKGIQEMMIDVLFCYCKCNASLSYKQGMHELLAPLIFVLHCDHQAFLHASEVESLGDVIKTVLDPDYVEHDAYAMFCQIMQTVEPWYVSKEISPTIKMSNVRLAQPFARNQDLHPSNVIVTKLTRIQDYLLKKHEPDLHAYLHAMDIPPQIYGIRWVRLLFGREFPIQDLLMLWDAIFADSVSFDLVDFIFVGMLMYIKDAMLSCDYPSCLHLLMKYPPVGDVQYFIHKALYLREPNQYPRPTNYTFQKPANFGNGWDSSGSRNNKTANKMNQMRIAEKAANVVSGLSTLKRRMNKGMRPQNFKTSISPQRMSKSTSEPMNLITDQSPEEELPGHARKGSTASMSQLEDDYYPNPTQLRLARSTQSLPQTEMTSRRSSSPRYPVEMEETSKYQTLPSRCRSNLGHESSNGGYERSYGGHDRSYEGSSVLSPSSLSQAVSELNKLERLCQMCAAKMGVHLEKLQYEMLRQQTTDQDEILVALAALKQVRDVLKGTLKPNSVFDIDDINVQDSRYNDDTTSNCQDLYKSSVVCSPHIAPDPVDTSYTARHEALPSSDTDISLPAQNSSYEESVTSGTTGSADTSPSSGGVADYPSNPPSLETSTIDTPVMKTNPQLSAFIPDTRRSETELHAYGVNTCTSSNPGAYQGQGHIFKPANHSSDSSQVGRTWEQPSNHISAPSPAPRQQVSAIPDRIPLNGTPIVDNNQNTHQSIPKPAPRGKKYHSAPPTPLDSDNSTSEDFLNTSTQYRQPTNQHSQQTVKELPRQYSGNNLHDPNRFTRKSGSLPFWGHRSTPQSRETSPINKLTDLFKGTFKF